MILGFSWTISSWGIYGALLLFAVGLFAIIKGGDLFVDAAVWMAEVLHMPKFLIGATVVSLATTLPELLVSILAVAGGDFSIGVGNAVGSVTANTGLILALSAIFVSGVVDKKEFGVKGAIIIAVNVVLFLSTILTKSFGIIPSIILACVLVFYIYITIKFAKKTSSKEEKTDEDKPSGKVVFVNILKFVVGAAGIVIGAQLLVENAKVIASELNISEGIVAITIVAIGTSLPELVTTVTSIVKKQGELGVGNIIGANIIDLVLILPICSFIANGQLTIEPQAYLLDIPACLLVSLIAVLPTVLQGRFKKWQGFALLGVYASYIALAAIFFIK